VDDCPDTRLNVPEGMLSAGNADFMSFIADGNCDESQMNKGEVAAKIKQTHPDIYIAYSIGGQVGSTSQSLFDYLNNTPEDEIVNTIMTWKYADGIDWDLEPPSGGVAAKYGEVAMATKLASISKKVRAAGKGVTMAGFGAWVWDQGMATLNGELIAFKSVEKYGVMVYPPAQGSADSAVQYFTNNWEKGAQCGPAEVQNLGAPAAMLAGGISGTASVSEAIAAAQVYRNAGAKSVIVWMVKPDNCSNMSGWVTKNSELPQWSAVLDVLKVSSSAGSDKESALEFLLV
jgi:hypothetical protein